MRVRHVWLLPVWLLAFMMELRSGLMLLLMVRAVSETRIRYHARARVVGRSPASPSWLATRVGV